MATSTLHRQHNYQQPAEKLPTQAEEGAATSSIHLRDAKPRRPRNHRRSITWDPTLDIYDDTFAFKQSVAQQPGATTMQPQQAVSEVTQSTDRRSTLLAHPAQRIALGTNVVDANTKRRRTPPSESIMFQQPAWTSNTVQLERIPERHATTIGKNPRRRTIYIPADDTTIATIHPGVPMNQMQQTSRRPRRSDAFLDLATQNMSAASPTKERHTPPKHDEVVRRVSRTSLAAAPRRAPLQEPTRAMQVASINYDMPGTGDGKENIPPGFGVKTRKQGQDDTLDISLITQKEADVALKHNPPSPLRRLSSEAGSTREDASDHRQPHAETRQFPKPPCDSSTSKRAIGSSTSFRRSSMLPSSRRSSTVLEARSSTHESARSRSTFAEKRPDLMTLSARERSSQLTAASFPVLTEDIAQPELYEDRWLSHQETALTECINSLLNDTRPTDVKDPHAHSTLKRELSALYSDQSVDLMHRRLQASLRFGALAVSKETLAQVGRYKDDMQHKRRLLDLWLKSYDLEVLQAAAEVVVGREIPPAARLSGSLVASSGLPKSPSRRRTLETFLRLFLLGNEDATKVKVNVRSSLLVAGHSMTDDDYGSQAWAWRRTVVRSLMISWLLDRLQESQSAQRPVCLFQSSSAFKSSVAVVQALGNLLLPSAGNIVRTLDHLSYRVSHVQYPLQEHRYHIDNLAVDMRDGVALTRLVETLLYQPSSLESQQSSLTTTLPDGDVLNSNLWSQDGKECWPLSQHLKYPCVSRVQKVYNVQVALSALREVEGLKTLLGSLKAEDIVDGHREKTVSLLWAMVSRWGLGALVNFRLVRSEIARLRKAWSRREGSWSDYGMKELPRDDFEADSRSLEGLESQTKLLKIWARSVARLQNMRITNLSTSFADGKAYASIVQEYATYVEHGSTLSGSCCESPVRKFSRSAAMANSVTSPQRSSRSVIQTLEKLGCSPTFTALFASSSGQPTITGYQTTIPLLAFLASRLLPISQPHVAAMTIQRAWRRTQMNLQTRKRIKLALLARECSYVVQQQQRIVDAASTIQRAWRKRERFLTKPRCRGNIVSGLGERDDDALRCT